MWFAVSLFAHKGIKSSYEGYIEKTSVCYAHDVTYFKAVSEDEANGKALRLCKEFFPESENWIEHSYRLMQIVTKKVDKCDKI